MEWLLLALAGGGVALFGRRVVRRRRAHRAEQEQLDGVRRLVEEDVTLFGELLRRLDTDVPALDDDGRFDYQHAVDAYEAAQWETPRINRAEEVTKITDALSSGRYALACVQARVAGLPLPEHRLPCFFDPQHGPSTRDVLWTSPLHGTRTVPACAEDATRVAAHQPPDVRRVELAGQAFPYWEAGAAYLRYGEGYFLAGVTPIGAYAMDWAFRPPAERGGRTHPRTRWSPGDFSGIDHVARGDIAVAESVAGLGSRRPRSGQDQ